MMIRSITALLGLLTTVAAGAAEVRYLPPAADDFTIDRLVQPAAAKAVSASFNTEKAPVSLSWALDADTRIEAAVSPHRTASRQYWLDTDAGDLSTGLTLHTTAPGALVRISPLQSGKRMGVEPGALSIRSAAGRFDGEQAIARFAGAKAMAETGAGFSPGTVAFRLNPQVGSGELELRIDGLAKGKAPYVVHVFEPDSGVVLELSATRDVFAVGQPVVLDLALTGAGQKLRAADLSGYLSSPGGEHVTPLRFVSLRGSVRALGNSAALPADAPGLWEAHVFLDATQGRERVLRDAQTAFAVTVPTARFSGEVRSLQDELGVSVGLDAAMPGRYELRGVIYGTLADGQMVPIAMANAAEWVSGAQQVDLIFDRAAVLASDAVAPYEIRHFQIHDQTRMAPLWRQHRAFMITP